jgi:hypothetical protein
MADMLPDRQPRAATRRRRHTVAMSMNGTDASSGLDDLPPLVVAAVDHARSIGFGQSCRPEHTLPGPRTLWPRG